MMACSSPCGTSRSIPLRIGLPSTSAVSPSIFSMSANRTFQGDLQQLLRFHREFHRQLLQHLAAEAVDDEPDRILLRQPAAAAVEELVLGDAAGGRLMLHLGRDAAILDIGHGMRAALV